ncbi:hypothetical protein T08_14083 [Trichinella sp. T8]|nr:hypothetical protein T08_14083 [Trichinella sp. T8]
MYGTMPTFYLKILIYWCKTDCCLSKRTALKLYHGFSRLLIYTCNEAIT